ncbi:hypothetical protein ONZ45_g15978 [Pleurotus djamor]|nr:hypothetical protein ONZ45_g15978 [Pleurotus djamor]
MPEHKGFSAWITVEGAPATEYAPRILEKENKAECWIASEVGKRFEIHLKPTNPKGKTKGRIVHKSAKIYLDDIQISQMRRQAQTSCRQRPSLIGLHLDEEQYMDSLGNGQGSSYGTIRVEVWQVKPLGYNAPRRHNELPSRIVHESSKKAGVHCVGLSEQPENVPIPRDLRRLTCKKKLATFSFFYQPLAVLQANEIAPRPPPRTPSPAPDTPSDTLELAIDESKDDKFQSLQEERRQLQARMDAISALLTKPGSKRKYSNSEVKTEDSNEPGLSTRPMTKVKKVKSEATDKPTIRLGEIIDLTLD